jgi:hypothetical protein
MNRGLIVAHMGCADSLIKRFVSIHDGVANLHNFPRHAMSSSDDRALRSEAMVVWREIAELGVAA